MAPVPDEQEDKVASPATEASAERENSLRVTTAHFLVMDDLQPCSSRTLPQIGLRNDLSHAPVFVEHSLSIQPDNNERYSDKK